MGWGREGEGSGLRGRMDVIEELKSFWGDSQKKNFGGGGVALGEGGGGVRLDVNEELKFLCKLKIKNGGGGQGGGWGGGGQGG